MFKVYGLVGDSSSVYFFADENLVKEALAMPRFYSNEGYPAFTLEFDDEEAAIKVGIMLDDEDFLLDLEEGF